MHAEYGISKIYKLDKKTGELKLISDIHTSGLKYSDGRIYFVGDDNKLYGFKPDEEIVSMSCEGPVEFWAGEQYEVLNGNIYFINSKDGKIYREGSGNPLNNGTKAAYIELVGEYIKLNFDSDAENSIKSIFVDREGKHVLETVSYVAIASSDPERIIYYDREADKVMMKMIK